MKREDAKFGVRVKCLSDGLCGRIVTPRPDNCMGCEIYLDNGEQRWEEPEDLEIMED